MLRPQGSMLRMMLMIIIIQMTACDAEIEKPQVTALQFLTAVYMKKDIELARSFVAERLQDRMERTPTIRTLQIQIMGIYLDKCEKIRLVYADMDFFHLKTINVKIAYQLIGIRNGIPFIDVITMRMDYNDEEEEWKVTKIIPDKFNIHL